MDSGFYAACTALMARSQTLDLVANNLANVSTPGYRAQHSSFSSLLATSSAMPLSGLNQAVNDYSVLGGGQLDLSQGSLERTGNDLDLGIEGKGFFAVQTAGGELFTRDGNFHVSSKGQLITSAGDAVLGTDNRPITIVGAPVSVSPDGTISVNGALAGQLKVVDFPAGTPLTSAGKTYYSAPEKAGVPSASAGIQQGMLESSNVNPVASSIELITVQRYAELMQRALTMFHTEMNQIATQDLPKVTNL
ncbi:MAG: flagellar basal-body rod protein FlgF [Candidatus Sulfotelmatobacter sp.]|jgi:flagellar basal-body rod protein FlgF/flagellar basal-body rod protein FlgG